ncbi:MAG: ABC transporter, partial [Oscillospiraceae bacterium]
RQRVGIAQALIGNPDVLILDEPTVGLDPKQIIDIRNLIKSLGEKHTVILSSHILPEIQAVCDRVIVIAKGKLVADDTTANLAKKMSDDRFYNIIVEGPQDEVYAQLSSITGMKKVEKLAKIENGVFEYSFETQENCDVRREVFKRLASRSWPLLGMRSTELSLEDIFLKLTKDNGGAI